MKKKMLSMIVAGIMTATLFAGCGSSGYKYDSATSTEALWAPSESYNGADAGGMYDYMSETEAIKGQGDFSITDDAMPMDTSRKLIVTVNLDTETKNYDESMKVITDKVSSLGGYIEDMNTSNYSYNTARNCKMTIRVPSKNLKEFLGVVENTLNVTNYRRSAEDVTLDYVDTESRISALKVEQERLEEFLGKAQTIEEVMQIEARMTEVRYQLENFESIKRTYDNKIDYATVYLDVREVVIYSEPVKDSMGSRIAQGFKDNFGDAMESVSNTFVGLIVAVPTLIGVLLNLILVLFIPALIVLFILWCCGVIGSKKRREERAIKTAAKKVEKDARLAKEKADREAKIAAAKAKAEADMKAKEAAKMQADASKKVEQK